MNQSATNIALTDVRGSEQNDGTKTTKGERTRERLLVAAREALAEHGYHGMRVADVAKVAGVSQGTFYLYFENKREVALAVLRQVLDEGRQRMLGACTGDDPFLEVLEPTAEYVRMVYENAGTMRGLLQFVNDDAEAARLWADSTHGWLERVTHAMDRRCGRGKIDAQTRTFVAYAMNWMVDGVLQSLLTRNDPYLQGAVQSPEQLAEGLSVLWYRAIYGADPPADSLQHASDILNMRLRHS